jgi:hypothetical protein
LHCHFLSDRSDGRILFTWSAGFRSMRIWDGLLWHSRYMWPLRHSIFIRFGCWTHIKCPLQLSFFRIQLLIFSHFLNKRFNFLLKLNKGLLGGLSALEKISDLTLNQGLDVMTLWGDSKSVSKFVDD